jgi:hypothetical protein
MKTVIQLLSGIVAIEGYFQFERVIFVLKFYVHLRLVQPSPINYAGASRKGNMFFTQKLYVQIANTHGMPQSQTKTQPMLSF